MGPHGGYVYPSRLVLPPEDSGAFQRALDLQQLYLCAGRYPFGQRRDGYPDFRGVEVPESRGRVHGNIIELEPGKLVCLLRSRAADHIYRSESNDNGETWSVPVPTPLRNNNASISAIKLQSGALAIIYNDVSFNEDGSLTVWPDQRCPVAMAISEDGGKTWPWRRIVEHGEGFIGPWNDVNNRRYEYPVMMQSKDGKIHAAYAWGRRVRIKYVCVDEAWIRGAKVCKGAEDNPEMPCNR